MSDLLRDAPIGQIIRWATKNRLLKYPEEKEDFQCPNSYAGEKAFESVSVSPETQSSPAAAEADRVDPLAHPHALTTVATAVDGEATAGDAEQRLSKIVSRADLERAETRADLEQAYSNAIRQETLKTQPSRAIVPERTADGVILVDWYTTDDQENPQNWSKGKKGLVIFQIYIYTLAVYMGSAIYTPSIPYVMEQFGISQNVASLGLSMYVVGYGIGPLFFSPLSEIPLIGRNPPYLVTFAIFVILCVPTALVDNFAGLVVLRFLQGFFGSPCLATGGASIGDIYSLMSMPYFLTGWAAFATAGPSLGPLISGFSVPATNWHWSLWEILWLAGPVFISLFFLLPETSSPNILLRRAKRLRKLTGNNNLRSQSEIDQANLSVNEVIISNLWRPIQINALDPAVLFTSVYTALMYAIYYTFFEVFPIVYATGLPNSNTHGFGMNGGQIGLIFLSISVGVSIAIPLYMYYLRYIFEPEIRTKGLPAPERRLVPSLWAALLLPISLFWFAWTGEFSPRIHWIAPTLAIVVFTVGVFLLFQCLFIYIPLTYPQYAASLFAANDFARSVTAGGAIHFAQPLFHNLGVGRGVSLLAGLTVGGVIGIWLLYIYGDKLRAKSRFAAK